MGIGASSVIGRLNTLRIAAFMMAVIAVADPAVVVQRHAPIAVDLRGGSAIHERLARDLRGSVDFDSALEPAALVLTSGTLNVDSIPAGIPVSTIAAGNEGPNVSVLEVRTPAVLRRGWSAPIRALVRGTRMAGKSSVVALEHSGIELDATKHTWTREDETVELALTYLPAAAGVRELQVMARPAGGERRTDDNRIVSTVTVQDRRLKVLVHEPRPSWTAAFVRRALEDDPDFEVAALARVSKGLEVRAG